MLTADPIVLGATLPTFTVTWKDSSGALLDLSAYTFTMTLTRLDEITAAATKSTGITGGATDPNVTIAWSSDDFTGVTAGTYVAELVGTRTADSKNRRLRFFIPFI